MSHQVIILRAQEKLNRLRVAVIEQAVGLNLMRLAKVADSSDDESEILQTAVEEIARRLFLDEDQARLAVFAGIMVGRLTAALRSARRPP